MLPPKIVACEGAAIILRGSQEKKGGGGGPVIRACSVISSKTVCVFSVNMLLKAVLLINCDLSVLSMSVMGFQKKFG